MNTMDYLYDTGYGTTAESEEPQDPIYDFDVTPYGWGELNTDFHSDQSEDE